MLTASNLSGLHGLRHGFLTRRGGVSTGFTIHSMPVSARMIRVKMFWKTAAAPSSGSGQLRPASSRESKHIPQLCISSKTAQKHRAQMHL